jgi:hypothetical protein
MSRRPTRRHCAHESPRVRLLSILTCFSLLLSTLVLAAPRPAFVTRAQSQSRGAQPQPGPPAYTLPNLDDVRRLVYVEPQTPLPIPSTRRSPRKPLVPRNGLKVGDPGTTLGVVGQVSTRSGSDRVRRGTTLAVGQVSTAGERLSPGTLGNAGQVSTGSRATG